jgi:ribosomal protein S14
MKHLFVKDQNRRKNFVILEKKLIILKSIFQNLNLHKDIRTFAYNEFLNLIKFNSHTKIRNRCLLTNRARAVYRKFKLSRIFFKQYALEGELVGVQKAS